MATKTASKKTTAKKSTPTKKAAPAKKAEWVKPAKPAQSPTSLNERDYQYKDAKGEFRYFQGYDAAYKRALMLDSRAVPVTDTSEASVKVLIAKGWSTEAKERDMQARAIAKAERAEARAKKAA